MKALGIVLVFISMAGIGFLAATAAKDDSGLSLIALFGVRNPIIDFAGFWLFVGILAWIAGVLEDRLREVRDALKSHGSAESLR